jgi:ribosomal protein S18 acetylase RimI-like enzyme
MSPLTRSLQYRRDTATSDDVHAHLTRCDADFTPPLSTRLDLRDYAGKLAERAARFEAWDGEKLVGLVAAYVTPGAPQAFISNVSVEPELRGHGVAAALVADCIDRARDSGAARLKLEVATADRAAGRFYEKLGFTDRDADPADRPIKTLTLDL